MRRNKLFLCPRKLTLENLETRKLLAADLEILFDANEALESYGAETAVAFGDEALIYSQSPNGFDQRSLVKLDDLGRRTTLLDNLSELTFMTQFGSEYYFSGGSNGLGFGIWKTDGTVAGTELVTTEVTYQPSGGSAVVLNDILYFPGFDAAFEFGTELWSTDGTSDGTELIVNIGTDSLDGIQELMRAGERLYFVSGKVLGEGTTSGRRELWTSDGTADGTGLVRNIAGSGFSSDVRSLVELGNSVLFAARGPTDGTELWSSDGTELGTLQVANINPGGSSFPANLTRVKDEVFFSADNGFSGRELWASDGTLIGTRLFADLHVGSGGSFPDIPTVVGDNLVFNASDGTDFRMWRVNTVTADSAAVGPTGSELSAVGGDVYFAAFDPNSGSELWRLPGDSGQSELVADLRIGDDSSNPSAIVPVGNSAAFSAEFAQNQFAVFLSDGTEEGTGEAFAFGKSTGDSNPSFLGALPEYLVYSTRAGQFSGPTTLQSTRVSSKTTESLLQVEEGVLGPLEQWEGRSVFLVANDSGNPPTSLLYQTDGTQAGTSVLLDIGALNITVSTFPSPRLFVLGDKILFRGFRADVGFEWFVTNGTAEGTDVLTELVPGDGSPRILNDEFLVHDGLLYFIADDGVLGWEVWVTDGTEGGTKTLGNLNSGNVNIEPRFAQVAGGKVYFYLVDSGLRPARWGLYVTEGTEETTQLIATKENSLAPIALGEVGGELWFERNDDLWKTDGTLEGTVEIFSGFNFRSFFGVGSIGDKLLIMRNDPNRIGNEFWVTDGTDQGTFSLLENASAFEGVEIIEDQAFFFLDDDIKGTGLWSTDGTIENTKMIQSVGLAGGRSLTSVQGQLFASVDSPRFGNEVFYLDDEALVVEDTDDYPSDGIPVAGSLRRMLEKAAVREGADTITFAEGFNGQIDLTGQLEVGLGESVSLVGPGAGLATISGGGQHRVFYVDRSELHLSGLTVSDGFSRDLPRLPEEVNGVAVPPTDLSAFSLGGGLLNLEGNVTLHEVVFRGNQTGGFASAENPLGRAYVGLGGAIANVFGAEMEIQNSRFENNAAVALGIAAGGAIDTDAFSVIRIDKSTFSGNQAQALLGRLEVITDPNSPTALQGAAVGGGVKASGASQMTVSDSTFTNNTVIGGSGTPETAPRGGFSGGGAVLSQALSLFVGLTGTATQTTIENSLLSSNSATGGDGVDGFDGGHATGGGAANWGLSELTVQRSVFYNNFALGGNGGDATNSDSNGGNGALAAGGAIDTGYSSFGTPTTTIVGGGFVRNLAVGGRGGAGNGSGVAGDGGIALGGAISNTEDYFAADLGSAGIALGEVTTRFSIVRNNRAEGGTGRNGGDARGGGIYNQGQLGLSFTAITNNRATAGEGSEADGEGVGGGIYNDEVLGQVDIDFFSDILLRRNKASDRDDDRSGF